MHTYQIHGLTTDHTAQNRQIESQLESLSTSVVELDAILFDDGDPRDALKHARSIQQRASKIVSLLQ